MKIFLAASYSAYVDYSAGLVEARYKEWLEAQCVALESAGHSVFCALRADGYKLNDADPAKAFSLDIEQIKRADILIAIISENISAGVQTEVGYAYGIGKKVIFARNKDANIGYFNQAMVLAGQAQVLELPFTSSSLSF